MLNTSDIKYDHINQSLNQRKFHCQRPNLEKNVSRNATSSLKMTVIIKVSASHKIMMKVNVKMCQSAQETKVFMIYTVSRNCLKLRHEGK